MKQIKIELLDNRHDDLFVVNSARVSMNKWKDKFDSDDIGLLGYLARERHSSPFRHVRFAFFLPSSPFLYDILDQLTPFESAGLVKHKCELNGDPGFILKHSVFGWLALLKKLGHLWYAQPIRRALHDLVPHCATALGIPQGSHSDLPEDVIYIPEGELYRFHNPWLLDLSFRCQVPLWLSRQLAKHQVTMSWNEVSRRYVSDPPEFFNQEFRAKPDGSIKQGSGEVLRNAEIPYLVVRDGANYDIHVIMHDLVDWYNECVDAEIAPETIRGYMPQNMMTQYIWSGTLPAYAHLCKLRVDSHAQKEAQYFGLQLSSLISEVYPGMWAELLNQEP